MTTRLAAALFTLALTAAPGAAAEPGLLDPFRFRDALANAARSLARFEAVEMAAVILRGGPMGPGSGWFHPSQSRYGWNWLAARCDRDKDGTVTRAEFGGPADLFARLDRNRDGALRADDFDWSDRSPYRAQTMPAQVWFTQIDRDSNGRIGKAEWDALFARLARDKGYVTADDLREGFPVTPPARPAAAGGGRAQGPSPAVLIQGLLGGEIGSVFEGPRLGQLAPDFTLKTADGSRSITLSEYRGGRPTVLIFGSFT